jgi:hypothetical protein
LKE